MSAPESFEDLPILGALRDVLAARFRAAEQLQHRRLRPAWFTGRTRLIVVLGVLLVGGGATASALLVRTGSRLPARPNPYAQVVPGAPPHVGPTPREAAAMLRQMGRPLPSTAHAYTLQPDPIGGPPWGVFVYRTTTGVICEHAGRVVAGHVGLLDARGQLRPWPADASGCTGYGSIMRPLAALGTLLGEPPCAIPPAPRRPRGIRLCPRSELRTVLEGVLPPSGLITSGPRSTPISATSRGRFTERTPDGAYVYVLGDATGLGCNDRITATVTYADGKRAPAIGMFPPPLPASVCRAASKHVQVR